jgi:hypothetical protein
MGTEAEHLHFYLAGNAVCNLGKKPTLVQNKGK